MVFWNKKKPLSVENLVEKINEMVTTIRTSADEIAQLSLKKTEELAFEKTGSDARIASLKEQIESEAHSFSETQTRLLAEKTAVEHARKVLGKMIEVFELEKL